MIISFREGCSGNWLAQLLVTDCKQDVFFRQDIKERIIPQKVLHFDGNHDVSDCYRVKNEFPDHESYEIITCHSFDYKVLRESWPNRRIIRIVPKTNILRAISLAYYKLHSLVYNVDQAFQYIKNYYFLHTIKDKLPTLENSSIIDSGMLDDPKYIEEYFNICLSGDQKTFLTKYWNLQYKVQPLDENKLFDFISKEELLTIFNKEITAFNFACYIFAYELKNGLSEGQRTWTIDDINLSYSWQDLLNLMEYKIDN